jgi:chromosome segregation ATPase
MIVKVEIKNFRNIKESTVFFNESTAIIAGQNGLGKSNTLNAINWLLTNTLLTDNYGKNENDIESIVPITHLKGQHTEVSIWLDTEVKFTKIYKTTYNRVGKVSGHTTEFKINDVVCKNAGEFYENLYLALDYKPVFKSLKIAEDRLFTDPLFALQKLEAKELRNLLVALGCSVTNEELYAAGYEHMRQYEKKYLGKWDVMRKDLKKQREASLGQINRLEAQVETYADVVEYDESKLESLLKRRDELVIQKNNVSVGKFDEQISKLKLDLHCAKSNYQLAIVNAENEVRSKINELKIEKQHKEETLNKMKQLAVSELNNKKLNIVEQIKTYKVVNKSYHDTLDSTNKEIDRVKAKARSNQTIKTNLSIELTIKSNEEFTDFVTCPSCGHTFPTSQEQYEHFLNEKQKYETLVRERIQSLVQENDSLKQEYDNLLKKKEETMNEIDRNIAVINSLEEDIKKLDIEMVERHNVSVDTKPIRELEEQIAQQYNELNNVVLKFADLRNNITKIENEITSLSTRNEEEIKGQILHIEDTLFPIAAEIEELYINKSKWLSKLEKQEELDKAVRELNDVESLLARVNEFIQEMISKINAKAKAKTGFDFVMLEENLSNENISEVCYATVDGVPFKDLNTSKKIEMGIRFIERCKYIAEEDFNTPHNRLPILADRLEGVDSLEKIKNLTSEQFICTRVSDEENITVL